jgi:hypothetical protein
LNFALIPNGTRQIVPYDPMTATIEAPSRVAPGETIMGRAIFKEFPVPEGHRLVFKPDAKGVYAVIHGKGDGTRAVIPPAESQ